MTRCLICRPQAGWQEDRVKEFSLKFLQGNSDATARQSILESWRRNCNNRLALRNADKIRLLSRLMEAEGTEVNWDMITRAQR